MDFLLLSTEGLLRIFVSCFYSLPNDQESYPLDKSICRIRLRNALLSWAVLIAVDKYTVYRKHFLGGSAGVESAAAEKHRGKVEKS